VIELLDSNAELIVRCWDPEEAAQTSTAAVRSAVVSSAAQQLVLRPSKRGTATDWYALLAQDSDDEAKGIDSVLLATAIDHACARVKSFKKFGHDWDGEGAQAPRSDMLDAALLLLRRLQPWHPTPSTTLDADGQPVIEFRDLDTSFFGKMRFVSPHDVEIFVVSGSEESYFEGKLASTDALRFLSDQMQITLRAT
jgi:hypothetical protein